MTSPNEKVMKKEEGGDPDKEVSKLFDKMEALKLSIDKYDDDYTLKTLQRDAQKYEDCLETERQEKFEKTFAHVAGAVKGFLDGCRDGNRSAARQVPENRRPHSPGKGTPIGYSPMGMPKVEGRTPIGWQPPQPTQTANSPVAAFPTDGFRKTLDILKEKFVEKPAPAMHPSFDVYHTEKDERRIRDACNNWHPDEHVEGDEIERPRAERLANVVPDDAVLATQGVEKVRPLTEDQQRTFVKNVVEKRKKPAFGAFFTGIFKKKKKEAKPIEVPREEDVVVPQLEEQIDDGDSESSVNSWLDNFDSDTRRKLAAKLKQHENNDEDDIPIQRKIMERSPSPSIAETCSLDETSSLDENYSLLDENYFGGENDFLDENDSFDELFMEDNCSIVDTTSIDEAFALDEQSTAGLLGESLALANDIDYQEYRPAEVAGGLSSQGREVAGPSSLQPWESNYGISQDEFESATTEYQPEDFSQQNAAFSLPESVHVREAEPEEDEDIIPPVEIVPGMENVAAAIETGTLFAPTFMRKAKENKGEPRPVLGYRIPGTTKCRVYGWKRDTKTGTTYKCLGCKKKGWNKCNVKVDKNNNFLIDPESLNHVCEDRELADEIAKGVFYQTTSEMRKTNTGWTPSVAHEMALQKIEENDILDEEGKLRASVALNTTESRRGSYSKANQCHDRSTMVSVQPRFLNSRIPGKTNEKFVRKATGDRIVIYTEAMFSTINGTHFDKEGHLKRSKLVAIVCDGTHKIVPQELGQSGQLYSIFGVSDSLISAPLMQIICNKKSAPSYAEMFLSLRILLEKANVDFTRIVFVTDYEKGAMAALKQVFPECRRAGCVFHYHMSMNRRLRGEFLRLAKKYKVVMKWFVQLKASAFLPKEYFDEFHILDVPVPQGHEAFAECKKFAEYFLKTWESDAYKATWRRFGDRDHRTSNVAEYFHSALKRRLRGRPPLSQLLDYLQKYQRKKYLDILIGQRKIEKKYEQNKVKLNKIMDEFQEKMDKQIVDKKTIDQYLAAVAPFMTRRMI